MRSRLRIIWLIGIAVLLLAAATVATWNGRSRQVAAAGVTQLPPPAVPTPTAAAQAKASAQLASRLSSGGGVDVQVTPVSLGDASTGAAFAVGLNTHSVELSYDLTQSAELRCDRGDVHEAVNWAGTAPGGHHRQGTLTFAPLDHPVTSLDLVIRGVAGVSERDFHWDMAS